jgi:unsaturated rhamnogalacturonyl hydrolase
MLNKILCLLLILSGSHYCMAQSGLEKWPKGSSPEEIGLRVAERFVASPHGVYGAPDTKPHIPYFEVCTWYGALTFADLAKNTQLQKKLVDRFEPLWTKDTSLLPVPDHVDYTVFGSLPLEIYLQTKDKKYLDLGLKYANTQWGPPKGPRATRESFSYYNKGLSWQTRLWIDDMYMITLIQSQAYRATGNKEYIDHAATEMVYYLQQLQQPNGLFYHAPDVPFFWGRGNGWMAAGMAELLRVLPIDNPNYYIILKAYKKMMEILLSYQMENGMWRQLVTDAACWPETSATAMFTFAMITGVKNGWLDKQVYGRAARKAWLALVSYINQNGETTEVCEGTAKKNDRQYYLDRKRITGDMHGQAPILWCASALLREKNK